MPSVVHVVVTANYAGVERYVTGVAQETRRRGWDVTVVGGDPRRTPAEVGGAARWLPGSTPVAAGGALLRCGRFDVCHVHMTHAELVGVATRWAHRGRVVATRHFAGYRGTSRAGRLLRPLLARGVDREIAISRYVASRSEDPHMPVIHSGVPQTADVWRSTSRTVLLLQRLEPEKDAATALRAWALSGLARHGWNLRVVGDGSLRPALTARVLADGIPAVTFAGWQSDVLAEFARAGVLLAPTSIEAFGLGVVEAMAAGIPIVAAAAGGHVETALMANPRVGFRPGDPEDAARALRLICQDDDLRSNLSGRVREIQRGHFTLEKHVDRLLPIYEDVTGLHPGSASRSPRPDRHGNTGVPA